MVNEVEVLLFNEVLLFLRFDSTESNQWNKILCVKYQKYSAELAYFWRFQKVTALFFVLFFRRALVFDTLIVEAVIHDSVFLERVSPECFHAGFCFALREQSVTCCAAERAYFTAI